MLHITPIPAFMDNYIWCIFDENSKEAVVIDPGSAAPVTDFLKSKQLQLIAILITHHHVDHTGGVIELKEKYDTQVYGFKGSKLTFIDCPISEGDSFSLLKTSFLTLEVPGHTLDHLAFFSEPDDSHSTPLLFCGDTLFSGGCGRIFEGTAEQMCQSLCKLCRLPNNTEIYCAHEYTLSNLEFALTLMQGNSDLHAYINQCKSKRDQNIPTLPSTLATELKINPFLRTDDAELVQAVRSMAPHMKISQSSIFAETRKAKDRF